MGAVGRNWPSRQRDTVSASTQASLMAQELEARTWCEQPAGGEEACVSASPRDEDGREEGQRSGPQDEDGGEEGQRSGPRASPPRDSRRSPSSGSDLSVSVGCFPCEDSPSCEDSDPDSPLPYYVPPIQSMWRTQRGSSGRPQGGASPGPADKLGITLAWDLDADSASSDAAAAASCALAGDALLGAQRLPSQKQLALSQLDGLVQKLEKFLENHQEDNEDDDDDSVLCESAHEEAAQGPGSPSPDPGEGRATERTGSRHTVDAPCPGEGLTPQGPGLAQPGSPTADTASEWPGGPEEEAPAADTQSPSCLNLWGAVHWLRRRVLSSLQARGRADRGRGDRTLHRGTRVQPQVSLESGCPEDPGL
ncbi:uncharacterized protein C12orf71 homolog [Sorex fumeus]|uniref:uncharacterized protein C12orf71 homolog n=1 Tax=Sorex fumeus TaxID=62283 RepID=UPI0024AD601B|nr:uncharacterized protein C12orf71 homolog [Sorex fumeus]